MARFSRPWDLSLILLFLLMASLCFKKIGSYDLGFHLKAGESIWTEHRIPHQDRWTWGSAGADYLDPHWLYQAALFQVHRWTGYPGIVLWDLLLVLGSFLLLWDRLRSTGCPSWIQVLLLLLALIGMERRFIPRPELVSWLFLSLLFWILESRRRALYRTMPVILLVWANVEGLFPLGWAVIALHLLEKDAGQKTRDPLLLRAFFLSLLAPLFNPNFLKGWAFPWTLWSRLRDPLYHRAISEFQPPTQVLAAADLRVDPHAHILVFFLLATIGLLSILATFSRRKAADVLLFLAFSILGWTAVRNIPLFILATLPLIARSTFQWGPMPRPDRLQGWGGAGIACLFLIGFTLRVVTDAYYVGDRRLDRFGWELDPDRLPVKAVDFIRAQDLGGPILNNLNFGGWLDLELPGRAFIDGRLEVPGREAFQAYEDSFQPGGLQRLIDRTGPRSVLLEYNATMPWVEQLRSMPDWKLVYLDGNSALYVLQGEKIAPLSWRDLAERWELPSLSQQEWIQSLPPRTSPISGWCAGLTGTRRYPMDLFSLGLFALKAGEYGAAQGFFGEGLRRTGPGFPETYYNLGVASLHLGQYALGKACLEETLRLDGSNEAAGRMLRSLP